MTLWTATRFPVLHYLLELAQTHVHRVNDAIQPPHTLSPPLLLPSVFPSIRVFPMSYYQIYLKLCSSKENSKAAVLFIHKNYSYSVQFTSVAQSCPTHCDPMNRSTPGLPVHHQLLEFTQTHGH